MSAARLFGPAKDCQTFLNCFRPQMRAVVLINCGGTEDIEDLLSACRALAARSEAGRLVLSVLNKFQRWGVLPSAQVSERYRRRVFSSLTATGRSTCATWRPTTTMFWFSATSAS